MLSNTPEFAISYPVRNNGQWIRDNWTRLRSDILASSYRIPDDLLFQLSKNELLHYVKTRGLLFYAMNENGLVVNSDTLPSYLLLGTSRSIHIHLHNVEACLLLIGHCKKNKVSYTVDCEIIEADSAAMLKVFNQISKCRIHDVMTRLTDQDLLTYLEFRPWTLTYLLKGALLYGRLDLLLNRAPEYFRRHPEALVNVHGPNTLERAIAASEIALNRQPIQRGVNEDNFLQLSDDIDDELANMALEVAAIRGDWNYVIENANDETAIPGVSPNIERAIQAGLKITGPLSAECVQLFKTWSYLPSADEDIHILQRLVFNRPEYSRRFLVVGMRPPNLSEESILYLSKYGTRDAIDSYYNIQPSGLNSNTYHLMSRLSQASHPEYIPLDILLPLENDLDLEQLLNFPETIVLQHLDEYEEAEIMRVGLNHQNREVVRRYLYDHYSVEPQVYMSQLATSFNLAGLYDCRV